jgi:hypothetical protein
MRGGDEVVCVLGFHCGVIVGSLHQLDPTRLPGLVESRLKRSRHVLYRSMNANSPYDSGTPRVYALARVGSIHTYAQVQSGQTQWFHVHCLNTAFRSLNETPPRREQMWDKRYGDAMC